MEILIGKVINYLINQKQLIFLKIVKFITEFLVSV